MSYNDHRPMSPHLQVYKLPLTAKLSIFHRATGVALFAGLVLMVVVLYSLATGEQNWQLMQSFLSNWFGLLVLFGISFCLYYHLCNGIRHLFWDTGMLMEKQSFKTTGAMVIIISVLLTLLTWIIGY
ncbi:MAG: succinate dehydrogenase, cytochrome b556 subunit [Pseudomonadota bacterium]